MSSSLTRRKLVAGVAWAAPVVAASATVPSYAASVAADCTLAASPAYSISGTDEGAKTVKTFTVPNNVYKLRFELVGGAGGTNNRMTPAGSGAKVTGVVAVTPGSTVQIVAAAGGIGDGSLTPTAGGEGYGNGGSVPAYTIPASVTAQVDAKYADPANSKSQVYAASGGGSSALLIDGTVVAVAGGGGSGAAQSVSSIVLTQKWLNSPTGVRQGLGYTMQGGAGGAGGSYLAPSVSDGAIASAENAPQWMRDRGNGSVTVTFCEAAA